MIEKGNQIEKNKTENQKDALVHFFSKMDIEMINAILDDELTYQDFRKTFFLKLLSTAFENLKNSGDSELTPIPGTCNNCNLCDTGFSFIGNNSGNYIDLIIQSENGKITDLFECTEFLNLEEETHKGQQIFIDILTNELLKDND